MVDLFADFGGIICAGVTILVELVRKSANTILDAIENYRVRKYCKNTHIEITSIQPFNDQRDENPWLDSITEDF